MTITVEDGSVVADANSFISLEDARTNAAARGLSISDDDTAAEQQLVQGYHWLIDTYESRMKGNRVSKDQTGCYPRELVYDVRGFDIDSDEIPQDIINAQVNMAATVNDGVDTNASKTDPNLAGFSVPGAYSETYQSGASTPTLASTPAISRMLAPYLKNGGAISCNREDYFGNTLYGWR